MIAVVHNQAALIVKLRQDIREAKTETREANKKTRESERKVKALLKLLESTKDAADEFLASRVKDAVKTYGITVAPKRKRKRRVAKKKVVINDRPRTSAGAMAPLLRLSDTTRYFAGQIFFIYK